MPVAASKPALLHVAVDPEAGAAYISLREIGPGEAVETRQPVAGRMLTDHDAAGRLLGVELLGRVAAADFVAAADTAEALEALNEAARHPDLGKFIDPARP